ncbi:hypothetical protein [Clostridium sp. C2-6-12]|uniref:hypothetical protein n=1 Tax=Clostridium sp. C2-6-12 TaxID=2698832 RepID=UPI00136BB3D4|nr:hypothetical protein [Clostridium sp. C2-6-12]
MSNSIGLAKFKKDNKIVYCEYDGIVDIMKPKLFNSFEEMDKCWKEDQNLIEDCDCDMEGIEIYSGRDFFWKGKACRKCMQIGENSNPDFSEVIFIEPDWATYHYIKINILQLLEYSFCFGKERISGAMEDYKRLSTSHIALLDGFSRSANDKFRSHYYREAVFKLSSLELAAGAPKFRCQTWFSILAKIDSCIFEGEKERNNPQEAIINFALARDFNKDRYENWPKPYESNVPATILYKLMTGKEVSLPEKSILHDNAYWLNLYQAITVQDEKKVKENCIAIAEGWFKEYEECETPIYDPENFPCYEPDCNAILSIALHREKMNIYFDEKKYRDFYIAALM